ncbi:hypothetical protein GLOIN_2v1481681 [Rhizophagus irregularis DAOM 181602=DAOM 197198]|nr:hypothetical protein GLOIN_2v1481681 [Rhizophagus irregularis DAOM 181602=DAOM 197198]
MEGIDFGEYRRRQDFGGRTDVVKFARQRVLNSPAIIVYHIPETLLEQHDHLNLSEDHRMWKDVVHHSRNGIRNVVDDYDSAYGPQATNDQKAARREFVAILSELLANTKDIHLAPLVKEHGAKAINIPLSLNSYKPKPWAYVTFNSQTTMDAAMEQTIGFQDRTLR